MYCVNGVHKRTRVVWLGLICLAVILCGNGCHDFHECQTESDCPASETCHQGYCVAEFPEDPPAEGVTDSEEDGVDDPTPDPAVGIDGESSDPAADGEIDDSSGTDGDTEPSDADAELADTVDAPVDIAIDRASDIIACTPETADAVCSGQPCVDGYCCDSLCDQECEACDVTGLEGLCMAIADGGTDDTCASPNGECFAGSCRCRNHWTGEDCDTCPGNWDTAEDCGACPDGFGDVDGDDCNTCVRFVDIDATGDDTGLSWQHATDNVQVGINLARDVIAADEALEACDVWIAEGIYYIFGSDPDNTGDRHYDTVNLYANVSVYGGFDASETSREQRDWVEHRSVLDGHESADDADRRVYHVITGATDSLIDGLIITGGYANGGGSYHDGGGGLRNASRVVNCTFVGNSAADYGGGISVGDDMLVVENSVFAGNRAGAGGGGIYVEQGTLNVEDCVFSSNSAGGMGGGISTLEPASIVVNSVFAGNSTGYYGGGFGQAFNTGTVALQACVFVGNSAADGGGGSAVVPEGGETISNCSFLSNSGDGIACTSSSSVANSIMWDDSPTEFAASTPVVSFSDIDGGGTTNNNINADPMFLGYPMMTGHTWTTVTYDTTLYQTILTDDQANWTPGALAGLFVQPTETQPYWYWIADNTETDIILWGDVTSYLETSGDMYELYDLHLSTFSPCIDAANGDVAPTTDIEGTPRANSAYVENTGGGDPVYADMGAYEWVDDLVHWVPVMAGTFTMGADGGETDEAPAHDVTVAAFEITQTEVTVAQYEVCVDATECTAPATGGTCNWEVADHHPVNCVSWQQATEFCEWRSGRLPSEAEWEFAARSGGQDVVYPWGDDAANCDDAIMDFGGWGCGETRTWTMCSKPRSNTYQGLCDMAGNVREWVQDWYHESYDLGGGDEAPTDGAAWEDPVGTERVVRGGGLSDTGDALRTRARDHAGSGNFSIGFRCVR